MNKLLRRYSFFDSVDARQKFRRGCPMPYAAYSEPVVLGRNITADDKLITDVSKFMDIDSTQCEYKDLLEQIAHTLQWISREIKLQFPGRLAPRLALLDCGSRTGNCPNHPQHSGYPPRYFDIQYYTYGPSNYTQKGEPRQNIWNADGILNLKVFDIPRNAMFVLLLAEAFPSIMDNRPILMHSKIKSALLTSYPAESDERKTIDKAVRAEDTPAYNHDRHMHVESHSINYGMQM